MSGLLETQHAVMQSLAHGENARAAGLIRHDGIDPAERLDIYRNTLIATLVGALRLTYPAVRRVVGEEFFEGAARLFIGERLPRCAYLDDYGAEFSEFLGRLPAAASLPYLADVAALEWAVSRALHAADAEPLDLARLAALSPSDCARACFVPCPTVSLLRTDAPADAIWRAVLNDDDAALQSIDLAAGPRWLLVERRESGLEVGSMAEDAWRFASQLFDGQPFVLAIEHAGDLNADALLAEHFATGRIVDFVLAEPAAI